MVLHAGMNSRSLSPHELRALSVEAQTDPRTVAKVLRGEPVRALPRDRVLAVLKRRGLLSLIPSPEQAAKVA